MTLSHPLASSAKILVAHSHDGTEQQILVDVTTAQLDFAKRAIQEEHRRKTIARRNGQVDPRDGLPATASLLLNRPRDWRQPSGAHRHYADVARAASIRHASTPVSMR